MKTTARFTVTHGLLTTRNLRQKVIQFAELVPADTCFHENHLPDVITLHLDAIMEMAPAMKAQLTAAHSIDFLELIRWHNEDVMRNFVYYLRQDLIAEIGEWLRVEVEQAAPPMPPEPEPVYVPTDLTVCGQKIAFVSTGEKLKDRDVLTQVGKGIDILKTVMRLYT